jgi:DNA-binding SARP family transcriptional activator
VDFRLLGPLEVESGGAVIRITGAKERAVLASLLFHANRLVSRDRLVDELWGEDPPATARRTLEAYVSRLRRALSAAGDGARIESQPGGYRILLAENELDALRFERLLAAGLSAIAQGSYAEADTRLTAALGLWRGEVLADLAFEPCVAGEADRLGEQRLAAVESHAAAALALGRHAELVCELQSLVAEYPFREELRRQLMLALYRSGRQADALALYLDGRRRLVDELGIEPGRELQELQQAILRQDPALDLSPGVTVEPSSAAAEDAAVGVPSFAREQRKVVTVVVGELGASALAERLDPEALEALLGRYAERMTAIVERHGGTLATSSGDTVMAVFGVPLLHEDDALRACRSAIEMRRALPELGVGGRIGVTTGEVVAGREGRLVTGAAVQRAAELAHAARLNEILLGAETVRLLGPLLEAEPQAPLARRGKAEPLSAYRLRRLPATSEREVNPFVDRERELALLGEAFRCVADGRELHLFTLLGPAGIGKSRLADEFLDALGSKALVVRGRCLSYGQAITYWPLVEMLRTLGQLARLALERVVSGGASSPQQLAWTVQRALQQAAASRPLVVVVEDLHWAEPALLDLLDAVCARSSGHPILVLCVARPELLEQRPGWAGGKLNATTVLLEPLGSDDCERLVDGLQRPLDPDQRRRVIQLGAGNPLFLEELTAFVVEGRVGDLPPRIQTLLQARLDRLPDAERLVLCCAAVEGTVFHTGGLEMLVPDLGADLRTRLDAATRKLLIRPAPGELAGEEAFRFRHQLIRDTAYAALPKADRARLHERFADWIERQSGDRGELVEIAAYHLEQAALARHDLGARDPALDARAAAQLATAGERAYLRTDLRAAANLWRRSLALLDSDDPQVPGLELELAGVLSQAGQLAEAQQLLEHAGALAADTPLSAAIAIGRLRVRLFSAPEGVPAAAIRRECAEAIPVLEWQGNHRALARAWQLLGWAERSQLHMQAAARAWANGARHARLAGDRAFETYLLGLRALTLAVSRGSLAAAARELEPIATHFPGEPLIEAYLLVVRGFIAVHSGRRVRGRTLAHEGLDGMRRSGYVLLGLACTAETARLELIGGNIDEAERLALAAIGELQAHHDRGYLGFAKAVLAEVRIAQHRYRETLELAGEAEANGGPDAARERIIASSARARAHAQLGALEEAKAAADMAVGAAGATDSLDEQACAHRALAEVLSAADELPTALAAAEEADRLYATLERMLERRQVAALAADIKRRIARTSAPTTAA